MKLNLKELNKLIKETILEKYGSPAPSKPAPSREPGIAEPDTKPQPKRRTLTPPKEAPATKPKAESKDIINKIVKRYKGAK
jgi:hypothetical protein